jgi:hypothetical protein
MHGILIASSKLLAEGWAFVFRFQIFISCSVMLAAITRDYLCTK